MWLRPETCILFKAHQMVILVVLRKTIAPVSSHSSGSQSVGWGPLVDRSNDSVYKSICSYIFM